MRVAPALSSSMPSAVMRLLTPPSSCSCSAVNRRMNPWRFRASFPWSCNIFMADMRSRAVLLAASRAIPASWEIISPASHPSSSNAWEIELGLKKSKRRAAGPTRSGSAARMISWVWT